MNASPSGLLRCFVCLLAFIPAGHAADLTPSPIYEGKPIARVRFEPPAQPIASSELARLVPFSAGMPLHLADVRTAIKRLYATGEFNTVEAGTEPAPGGLTLVFRTTRQWFVGPVVVSGRVDPPPNRTQLVNGSRLDLGVPFSDTDLDTAVTRLHNLLERNGLYHATVKPVVVRDPQHQQVSITFQVTSGRRARLMLPNIVGDTRIPKADVARAARFKGILFFPWKMATQENQLNGLENIRAKYGKQDRLTASVTREKTEYLAPQNRVRLTIRADGGPKVKIVSEGAKVSKGDLNKYVPVYGEGTVNQDLLVAGSRNLRDYFQNSGYFDVQVRFSTHDAGPDLKVITYTVTLGQKHRVVSVKIKGNRYFTTEQIRERMFIQPKGFIRLRHGRYSESFATRDEQAIAALYRDSGFRDSQVNTTVVNVAGKPGGVAITINIKEGPQSLVSHLAVNGLTLKNSASIIASLASSPGEPYSDTAIALDRQVILEACQSAGYPDATFDFQSTPASANRVDLEYNITQGMSQRVRDILISGLRTTRRRLINPVITIRPGDPLSWNEMGRVQRQLYNLGVFDKVDMAIQNPDGAVESKYVVFHLVEGHLYSMAIGVGAEITKIGGGTANSISDPTGVEGFAPRFDLQLRRMNLWGLGQSLTFNGRYSTLDRRAGFTYEIPRFRNVESRTLTLTALYDNTRDVLTFTAVKLQAGIQLAQRINKTTSLLLRYSWTNVQVDQSTLKINPLLIPLYSQPAQVGLFGANLVQDHRDNPADAHRGYYNSLDLGLADHAFGGNKNFVRFLGRNSLYWPLGKEFVLASNTVFGVISPFSTGGTATDVYMPLPERFFGGGEAGMRQFPWNQAGPRDLETGFPLGGNALLFHSTELRFPLIGENIDGVLFHDMGNVYSSLGALSFRVHQDGLTDFNYMVHAVGFGLRYRTPIGPVRLDLAYALNPPTFNGLQGTYDQLLFGGATRTIQNTGHFQFFFSIGQAF